MQKKKFREADIVAERTEWMGLLMLVKRKAKGPGVTPSPMLQENIETQNIDSEVDREDAGRRADFSTETEVQRAE